MCLWLIPVIFKNYAEGISEKAAECHQLLALICYRQLEIEGSLCLIQAPNAHDKKKYRKHLCHTQILFTFMFPVSLQRN